MSDQVGRYRKKQQVVEALQWTGENGAEVAEFLGYERDDWRADLGVITVSDFYRLVRGDFVVKHSDGKTEPLSAPQFDRTYEPIPPAPDHSEVDVSEEALHAAKTNAGHLSPICNVCQVAYVEDFRGPCQEPLPPYEDPSKTCPGTVDLTPEYIAENAVRAAAPVIKAEERERLLGERLVNDDRRRPRAKPQPEGGRTVGEMRMHQRYLRELAEIAEARADQAARELVGEQRERDHRDALTINRLLDAVERQDAAVRRLEKERDDYRGIAGEDTSKALLEAEQDLERVRAALDAAVRRGDAAASYLARSREDRIKRLAEAHTQLNQVREEVEKAKRNSELGNGGELDDPLANIEAILDSAPSLLGDADTDEQVERLSEEDLKDMARKVGHAAAPIFAAQGWTWNHGEDFVPGETAIQATVLRLLLKAQAKRGTISSGRFDCTVEVEDGSEVPYVHLLLDDLLEPSGEEENSSGVVGEPVPGDPQNWAYNLPEWLGIYADRLDDGSDELADLSEVERFKMAITLRAARSVVESTPPFTSAQQQPTSTKGQEGR